MNKIIISIFVITLISFRNCEVYGQDLEGYEWLECNVFEDSTYSKFEKDTLFFKIEGSNDFPDFTPISTYSIIDNTIIINDLESSSACDPTIAGKYLYNIENDSLTFQVVEDECDERFEVLSEVIYKKVESINSVTSIDLNAKIYPNPVQDNLVVRGGLNAEFRYAIYNQAGAKLKSGITISDENINLNELKSGAYILVLISESGLSKKSFNIFKL